MPDMVNGRISNAAAADLRAKGKRYCPMCKETKLLSAFSVVSGVVRGYCKPCKRKYDREGVRSRAAKKNGDRRALIARWRDLLGRKCGRCGYDEFSTALDFHHVDPEEKEISISGLATRIVSGCDTEQRIIDSIDKCALLCRNCHGAYHSKEWNGTWKKCDGLGWELDKEEKSE